MRPDPWDEIERITSQLAIVADVADDDDVTRIRALVQLARAVDREIDRVVIRARDNGVPWAEIGAALNVTRQGAQHRHRQAIRRAGRIPPDLDGEGVMR